MKKDYIKPIISIIVPVYNAEKYIERCIKSILQQTLTHWELVLVNDGSRDNSLAICQQYADQEKRIFVFNQKNSGANKARLNGIQQSHGQYLVFLDADDYLPKNSLVLLYTEIKQGFDFVRGNLTIVNDNGVCAKQEYYKIKQGEFHTRFIYTKLLLQNSIAPYLCGAIYKRDFFSDTDFIETIKLNIQIGEDYLTLLHASVRCCHFKLTEQTVYYYYHNQNGTMNGKVLGRKTSHKIDSSITKLLTDNNANELLHSIAEEKAIKGMIMRQFIPELKFSWTEYKAIFKYMQSTEGNKKILSIGRKYTCFIKHPLFFYIYTRVFCLLFFLKKRKCKRHKIL